MRRKSTRIMALGLVFTVMLVAGCRKPEPQSAPVPAAASETAASETSGGSLSAKAPTDGKVRVRIQWLNHSSESPISHPVRWVSMVDEATGYGLGQPDDANALFSTRDGGATWQRMGALPDGNPPWSNRWGWDAGSVSFVNAADGWAVNASGSLLHASDGGKQWLPVALPPGTTVAVRARFATPQKGCVQTAAEDMPVWWTKDGGATWEKALGSGGLVGCARRLAATFSANPDDDNQVLLEARADGLVWLIWGHGIPNTTAVSTDDGQHWQEYEWPASPRFGQISFGTQKTGCMITRDGRVLFTRDGGVTWQEAQ